jgi:phage shock protein C
MYCTRCGSELRETDRFCSQCGTNIADPHASPQAFSSSSYTPGRPLARLLYNKRIAGVCSGFARYFDCDITLMRVIWLILAFGTGVGFVAYVVAWIVMPKEYAPPVVAAVPVVDPGSWPATSERRM